LGGGLLAPPRLFPLEAFGIVWLDDTARSGSTAVTFSLIEGGAGLCPLHYDGARLRAYGCAAGELGLLTARSTGLATQRGPFVAGALEGRVTIRLAGPFAARAGVSAVLPFTRTDSRATTGATTTDVFRASLVGATADFGLGVEFP
jgi:hypothetical protein